MAIVDGDSAPPNGEVALRLARATFPSAQTALIARDDTFADALASAVGQRESPLLLVPSHGPVPADVSALVAALGVQHAVILGGEAAVGPEVAAGLAAGGLTVERVSGLSRFETAIAIARHDAPSAQTAILVRAFSAEGGSPTQAFADALAAGALSAREGWPILLSDTAALTPATQAYLDGSGIQRVLLIGGVAALSEQVESAVAAIVDDVERLAGADRFETALAIARRSGEVTAADAARAILVEATLPDAWAAGFAAASHAAAFDAPVVLTTPDGLPPSTAEWLAGGTQFAVPTDGSVALTCVVPRAPCQAARVAAGLPAPATVRVAPAAGGLQAGAPVTITVTGAAGGATASGTCLDAPVTLPAGGGTVTAGQGAAPACTLVVRAPLANGVVQTDTVDFAAPAGPLLLAPGQCLGFREVQLSADGTTAMFSALPGEGCDAITPGAATVFVDVATGALQAIPWPAGYTRMENVSASVLSGDGSRAAVMARHATEFTDVRLLLVDRATGSARFAQDLNPGLGDVANGGQAYAGSQQAFLPDGRLLGGYCAPAEGCFVAMDPRDGTLSMPGRPCTTWFAEDFDAVFCRLGELQASGPDAVTFSGFRNDILRSVEVRVVLPNGPSTSVDNRCANGVFPDSSTAAGGQVVYRACRDQTRFDWSIVAVTDLAAGTSAVVYEHTAPDALDPLRSGVVDPTGRFLPVLAAEGDGTTGRGLILDIAQGQHVDLGPVRGIPQLNAAGSFAVVATADGLLRLPVTLPS